LQQVLALEESAIQLALAEPIAQRRQTRRYASAPRRRAVIASRIEPTMRISTNA
jgi:hypothetical protein